MNTVFRVLGISKKAIKSAADTAEKTITAVSDAKKATDNAVK
jgi:hypothetical protein